MARQKKSQEEANTLLGRFATACNQSCETRPDLCSMNVQGGNKTQEAPPQNQAHQRFQIRLAVVAYLCHNLEWSQHYYWDPTQEPVCCIQTDASGHWGCRACFDSLWFPMAAARLITGMD